MSTQAILRQAIGHVRTPLYLNAYSLIASNAISSALGLLYWSIAARMYPVATMGASSAVISMMLFLSGVAQLNLRVALFRLIPEAGAAAGRLIWSAYGLVLALSAVAAVVVFGGSMRWGSPWSSISELASPLGLLLLVAGTMAWSVFNLQDGVLAGLRRTPWVPVENGAYAVAKIVILVLVAAALPTAGIVTSWVMPSIVLVVTVSVVLVVRWIPAHVARQADRAPQMGRRRLLSFVAADSVGALFALAASTLLPVIVVAQAGATQGAYFAIAWTIVMALTLVPVNMAASMTVETVHTGADLATETRRLCIHVARLLVPLVLVLEVAAPWILRIFGPDYAANATGTLRLAMLGLLPFAASAIFLAGARIRGQGRRILAVQASVAMLTLGGSFLLLRSTGILGVAIAWPLAQTLVALAVVPLGLWPLLRQAGRVEPVHADPGNTTG
jgi:O-antigen/teichoic acid export membrane protein